MSRSNRRRKVTNKTNFSIFIIVLLVIIAIGSYFLLKQIKWNNNNTQIESTNEISSESSNQNSWSVDNTSKNDEKSEEQVQNQTDENKSQSDPITFNMLVTGDIMCHNTQFKDAYDSKNDTYDFSYMFDDIKYYIQTADIAVGNLETTFAGKKKGYSNYPTFNTPEQLAENLKRVGFDVVSTANNHCMDSGYTGLVSTLNYLDKADISHTGTYASEEDSKKILIKDVKGVKIAFLSYTYGTNGIPVPKDKSYAVNLIDKDLIKEHIELAKKENVDVICVSMHWGIEYQIKPNQTQKDLADFLFQNGVDVIIGNHPHVPQPMEKRTITLDDGTTKDGFVVYSLGNFMADQNSEYTRDSALLNLNITVNKNDNKKVSINSATYTPIYYYKNKSVAKKRFKFIDIKKAIASYEAGADSSIGKALYNTLKTELKNIQKILGDEIK